MVCDLYQVLKFRGGIADGLLGRVSRHALHEWHAFGTLSLGPKSDEHLMVVVARGDWTRGLIADPPKHLWVRAFRFAGLPYTARMLDSFVWVATGEWAQQVLEFAWFNTTIYMQLECLQRQCSAAACLPCRPAARQGSNAQRPCHACSCSNGHWPHPLCPSHAAWQAFTSRLLHHGVLTTRALEYERHCRRGHRCGPFIRDPAGQQGENVPDLGGEGA